MPNFSSLLHQDHPSRANLNRYWPLFIILFVIFPLACLYARIVYAPSDDTYIFLVYVRNFLNGHGLTFNGAIVQGYTSLLWVVLLSILGRLGVDLPSLATALSLLSGLLALLATYLLASKLQLGPRWALLPVILLAFTGDFAYYMGVGLEQVAFTAFVAAGAALLYSNDPRTLLGSLHFPAFLALMVLLRPEGALVAGLLILILGVSGQSFWRMIRCGGVLVIMLAPVFIAGHIFYGYWLPNTYYVKSNAGFSNVLQGLLYLFTQSWSYIIILVEMAFLLSTCLLKKNGRILKKLWPIGLIVWVWVVYVTLEGGDNLVGGRMLLPILPLVYMLMTRMMAELKIKTMLTFASAALIGVGLVCGYLSNPIVRQQRANYRRWFEPRQAMGRYLHEHYPPGTWIALDPAGIIPYYSQLPTIDMLGLNDVFIAHHGERDFTLLYAHQAGDGAYVLSRNPEIILLGPSGTDPAPAGYISDREIWASSGFQSSYTAVALPGIGTFYAKR